MKNKKRINAPQCFFYVSCLYLGEDNIEKLYPESFFDEINAISANAIFSITMLSQ